MLNLTQRTNNSVQLPEEVDKALFLNDEGKLVLKDQDGIVEDVGVSGPLPTGGTTGQILAKVDNTNYNTEWVDTPSGGPSYLVYTALLMQTGTNPPTATVLENTLGFTPIWEYTGVGIYNTQQGFNLDKTVVITGNSRIGFINTGSVGPGKITITVNNASGTPSNGFGGTFYLAYTPIEIRVYP